MAQLCKARNRAVMNEEKRLAQKLTMYENYICQYQAILLQCEQEYDLMINVRIYQEIVIPFFAIKHGQFAAVALTKSGANKMLRKVWESFIKKRDNCFKRTPKICQQLEKVRHSTRKCSAICMSTN